MVGRKPAPDPTTCAVCGRDPTKPLGKYSPLDAFGLAAGSGDDTLGHPVTEPAYRRGYQQGWHRAVAAIEKMLEAGVDVEDVLARAKTFETRSLRPWRRDLTRAKVYEPPQLGADNRVTPPREARYLERL